MFFFISRQARSKDPDKRKQAAAKLVSGGRASTAEGEMPRHLALLTELAEDPDGDVRAAAYESLATVADARAVGAIVSGLKDSDKFADVLSARMREAAAKAFVGMGAAAIPVLGQVMKDRNAKLREMAVVALGGIRGKDAEAMLVSALQDSRSNVRQAAINALATIGDAGSVRALSPALEHKDAATRKVAAEAVASVGGDEAARALRKLTRDVDRAVREAAVAALGRNGAPEAVETLLAVFEGQDRELRQMAAAALATLNWQPVTPAQRALHAILRRDFAAAAAEGAAAVEPLAALLTDKSAATRVEAAQALGRTASDAAVKPLIVGLQDNDQSVRKAAADGLVNIGPAAVTALACSVHEAVRNAVPDVVLRIGAAAARPLVNQLRQGEPYTADGPTVTRVNDEDEAEHAERAAHLLNRLLGGQPAAFDADCLRDVSHLRNVVHVREVLPANRRESPTIVVDVVVDCQELRDRASAELQRRKGVNPG